MIRKLLHTVVETTIQPFELNISPKKDSIPFEWIASSAPCFPVVASNIKILTKPDQFYDFLIHCCREARNRVTLASLYLGIGHLEERIINTLLNNESFMQNKMHINILLDYTRGSRSEINSRTMLLPLLKINDQRCNISLYHTPVLRGLYKKYISSPWNELFGLQHMKLYIFDDTLIISGANLSNDYFTNRQDRYFVIKDQNLSDFYCGLVSEVQNFSLKLDKHNHVDLKENWHISPYDGDKNTFIEKAKGSIQNYMEEMKTKFTFKPGSDTWIFPLVQMGQLGVEHDSIIMNKILADSESGSCLKLATGYFNLTNQYMDTLINESKANCDILMAHPKANGFLGAKGPAGGIPYAYSLLAHRFKNKLIISQQDFRIKLYEYLHDDWTYHAKGLWYYPPNCNYPCMTLIGSPNLGERSAKRDLETQIAIVTENTQLKRNFHDEWCLLYKSAIPADTDRSIPKWIYMFILFFKSYF